MYYAPSDWLWLGPFRTQVNSFDPLHLTIKELSYDHECDKIKTLVAPKLETHPQSKPSLLKNGEWMDVRIMKK